MSKILVVIQARMNSSRLPGKVLKLISGKPLIVRLIENLSQSQYPVKFIVATSSDVSNEKLINVLNKNEISYYIGSELNVLSRFIEIYDRYKPDIIVRATADNPLMSAACMDLLIQELIKNDLDYTFMKDLPEGISTEVISGRCFAIMKNINNLTEEDKEHVTMYIKKNPEIFNIKLMNAISEYNYPHLSFTVDTQEEFNKISKIYQKFGEETSLKQAIKYLLDE